MALKVETRDGTTERHVVIGCVVSKAVLGPIADRWNGALFASKYANLIVGWCVHHYRKTRAAPGAAVEYYFRDWADSGHRDRDLVEAVESLLAGLAHEAERLKRAVSPEHLIDVAGALFERVALADVSARITVALERGDAAEARRVVDTAHKIEIGADAGVDVLTDAGAMERAFERRAASLIELPGSLGMFYGGALARGRFVGFLGKEKVGKSYFVRDLVWRAVEQDLNVAHFELGDDVQEDVLMRFAERASGRSAKPDPDEPSRSVRYERPVALASGGDEPPDLQSRWGADDPVLSAADTMRVFEAAGADGRFKLSCHPAGTLSVAGAEAIMEGWERDGWHPDVVAFDYADLAAPIDRKADKLEQINETWIAMRSVSQRRQCLVLTATQCNREGFAARVLSREHVGGDHRKLAHVTMLVGINQSVKEKSRGLYRLNPVVGRQLTFGEHKQLWCAGCLAVGNPAVFSTF